MIQEFVLAKDALIICGDAELNWKAFASAHEKMIQYGLMDWGTFNNWYIQTEKKEAFSGSFGLRVMMEIKNVSTLGPSIANIVRSFSERKGRDRSGRTTCRTLGEMAWNPGTCHAASQGARGNTTGHPNGWAAS